MRLPPCSTRTSPLFPSATLFRSDDRKTVERDQLQPLGDSCAGFCVGFDRNGAAVRGIGERDDQRELGRAQRGAPPRLSATTRSEEHTYELQSLMRISYAVFCLTKKKTYTTQQTQTQHK